MKKFLTAFLFAFIGLFLTACQNAKTENNTSNEYNDTLTLKVVTAQNYKHFNYKQDSIINGFDTDLV